MNGLNILSPQQNAAPPPQAAPEVVPSQTAPSSPASEAASGTGAPQTEAQAMAELQAKLDANRAAEREKEALAAAGANVADGAAAGLGAEVSDAAVAPPAPDAPTDEKRARIDKAIAKARRDAAQRAAREAELTRAKQRAAEADRLEARQRQLDEYARTNPLRFARELGLTPAQIAQEAIEQGTPEAQIRALNARIEAQDKALKDAQAAAQQREYQAYARQTIAQFHTEAKEFPAVARLPEHTRLAIAQDIVDRAKAANPNYAPSNSEILTYMEAMLSPAASPQRTQPAPGSGPNVKASQATPRTVTNSLSTKRPSAPANMDSLPDAEQKRLLADQLRASGALKRI